MIDCAYRGHGIVSNKQKVTSAVLKYLKGTSSGLNYHHITTGNSKDIEQFLLFQNHKMFEYLAFAVEPLIGSFVLVSILFEKRRLKKNGQTRVKGRKYTKRKGKGERENLESQSKQRSLKDRRCESEVLGDATFHIDFSS